MKHGEKRGNAASVTIPRLRQAKVSPGQDANDEAVRRAKAAGKHTLTPEESDEVLRRVNEEMRRTTIERAAADRARYIGYADHAQAIRAAASTGAASIIDARLRSIAAFHAAINLVVDDDEADELASHKSPTLHMLATTPALDYRDMTRKLAGLVADLLISSERPELDTLALAASALVDAVTLESGPIILPPAAPLAEEPAPVAGSAAA